MVIYLFLGADLRADFGGLWAVFGGLWDTIWLGFGLTGCFGVFGFVVEEGGDVGEFDAWEWYGYGDGYRDG